MNPTFYAKRGMIALCLLSCFALAACEPKNAGQGNAKQEETVSAVRVETDTKKPETLDKEPTAQVNAKNDDNSDDDRAQGAIISQKQAYEVLRKAVDIKEGMSLIDDGVADIKDKTCYLYRYGEMHDDHFVTLEHFAVCDESYPLVMDVIHGGDYVPYVKED